MLYGRWYFQHPFRIYRLEYVDKKSEPTNLYGTLREQKQRKKVTSYICKCPLITRLYLLRQCMHLFLKRKRSHLHGALAIRSGLFFFFFFPFFECVQAFDIRLAQIHLSIWLCKSCGFGTGKTITTIMVQSL